MSTPSSEEQSFVACSHSGLLYNNENEETTLCECTTIDTNIEHSGGRKITDNYVIYIFFLIYFIYFRLRWVFVAARGLCLVEASGGYSLLQCAGFSLQWLLLLRSKGSRCTGFSNCGTWAQ